MSEGVVATSYKAGDKFYIDPFKLLPLDRFLPKPKGAGGGRGGERQRLDPDGWSILAMHVCMCYACMGTRRLPCAPSACWHVCLIRSIPPQAGPHVGHLLEVSNVLPSCATSCWLCRRARRRQGRRQGPRRLRRRARRLWWSRRRLWRAGWRAWRFWRWWPRERRWLWRAARRRLWRAWQGQVVGRPQLRRAGGVGVGRWLRSGSSCIHHVCVHAESRRAGWGWGRGLRIRGARYHGSRCTVGFGWLLSAKRHGGLVHMALYAAVVGKA